MLLRFLLLVKLNSDLVRGPRCCSNKSAMVRGGGAYVRYWDLTGSGAEERGERREERGERRGSRIGSASDWETNVKLSCVRITRWLCNDRSKTVSELGLGITRKDVDPLVKGGCSWPKANGWPGRIEQSSARGNVNR